MTRCCSRSIARCALLLALVVCHGIIAPAARGEHGQFDQRDVNAAEEAYVFTPHGFSKEGQPAVASGADTARLHITINDAASGRPTFCRVNVVAPTATTISRRTIRSSATA